MGQFDKTFGTHPPKRDDTGKQIDAAPHERELDPFKPTIRKEDIDLEDSVGLGRKNKFRDVFGIQKALSNTGDFVLDMSRERGGELTIGLATAIEDFQRRNGLKVDGIVNPAGPTATRVGTILFGASDSDNQRLLRADHDKESSREVSQNGRAF